MNVVNVDSRGGLGEAHVGTRLPGPKVIGVVFGNQRVADAAEVAQESGLRGAYIRYVHLVGQYTLQETRRGEERKRNGEEMRSSPTQQRGEARELKQLLYLLALRNSKHCDVEILLAGCSACVLHCSMATVDSLSTFSGAKLPVQGCSSLLVWLHWLKTSPSVIVCE